MYKRTAEQIEFFSVHWTDQKLFTMRCKIKMNVCKGFAADMGEKGETRAGAL